MTTEDGIRIVKDARRHLYDAVRERRKTTPLWLADPAAWEAVRLFTWAGVVLEEELKWEKRKGGRAA